MNGQQDVCALLRVCPYSHENLKKLFVEFSKATEEFIEAKLHAIFFKDYFIELEAKTIVVEGPYTDRDFLDDHGRYYLKCFRNIEKTTFRFHFFKVDISEDQFRSFLEKEPKEKCSEILGSNYLGFIVVKPLMQTIIGRTCLKTYDESTDRHYHIRHRYNVNLFGIDLTVDSLAFQEQDSVVAACATSALWSAFHATGRLFQHPIPSPSAITELATRTNPLDKRRFPNHGLTAEQMAHAIAGVGLDPEPINAEDFYILKATVCAYISVGIPPILGGWLIDTTRKPNQQWLGMHAVTIAGFGINQTIPPCGIVPLKAERISKIYTHDDQVGPFSKMKFDGTSLSSYDPRDGKTKCFNVLSTHWLSSDPNRQDPYLNLVKFLPTILLLPLYPKIRIPLNKVMDPLVAFHEFLSLLINKSFFTVTGNVEWEITLSTVNQLKSEYLGDPSRNPDMVRILTRACPRFLWRAKAFHQDTAMFEILFDATDIEQTGFYFDSVSYDQSTLEMLSLLCKQNKITKTLARSEARYLLEHLAERV